MKLLIDGYNMICELGILSGLGGRKALPAGKLEDARNRLLQLLVKDLSDAQRRETTIVFDALEPPEFLPDSFRYKGIQVLFSRNYNSADEQIIEMIQRGKRGSDCLVVTSDHRIQNAATRRRVKFCDSAEWYYDGTPSQAPLPKSTEPEPEEKPLHISREEMDFWLKVFGEE